MKQPQFTLNLNSLNHSGKSVLTNFAYCRAGAGGRGPHDCTFLYRGDKFMVFLKLNLHKLWKFVWPPNSDFPLADICSSYCIHLCIFRHDEKVQQTNTKISKNIMQEIYFFFLLNILKY